MLAAKASATPATVRLLPTIGSALFLKDADAVVLDVHEVNAVAAGRDPPLVSLDLFSYLGIHSNGSDTNE